MIIYNTSFVIAPSVEKEWVEWMKEHHLPSVYASELIISFKLLKLLTNEQQDAKTYCAHIEFDNLAKLQKYKSNVEDAFNKVIGDKFGEKCLFFTSVLKAV